MFFSPATHRVFSSRSSSRKRRHPPSPPSYLKDHHSTAQSSTVIDIYFHFLMSDLYYLLCIILSFMSMYRFIRPACLKTLFIILRNSMSLHVIIEWLHTYIFIIKTRLFIAPNLYISTDILYIYSKASSYSKQCAWWDKPWVFALFEPNTWNLTLRGLSNSLRPPLPARPAMTVEDLLALVTACHGSTRMLPIQVESSFLGYSVSFGCRTLLPPAMG